MKKIDVFLITIIILSLIFLVIDFKFNNAIDDSTKEINQEHESSGNSIFSNILNKSDKMKKNKKNEEEYSINWNEKLTINEANLRNSEIIQKVKNIYNDLGLNNFEIYNENEFSYTTDNKIVYTAEEIIENSFGEVIYTYKNNNDEKYSFKLTSRYSIEKDNFTDGNLFDFSKMPQNEFFKVFTDIEDRDTSEINKIINEFLNEVTSEFSRVEIVNDYNGINETIIIRQDTIYYYLKTSNIDFAKSE
ncbi:hypothetical protein [uncultured Clostridium sp.]|uniref:hypothetical protein n=1 Tax=uncultured Clostridium sp. TaxID=59620 RepID=UPI0025D188F6|nr:hypothetical protein [uncultured Clostridium sp.]